MEVSGIYTTSQGAKASMYDYIMLPGGAHRPTIEVMLSKSPSGGLSVAEFYLFEEVGVRFGMHERVLSPEQLGDLYEVMHHRLHGHDARGLDPRNGPTRLSLPGR